MAERSAMVMHIFEAIQHLEAAARELGLASDASEPQTQDRFILDEVGPAIIEAITQLGSLPAYEEKK